MKNFMNTRVKITIVTGLVLAGAIACGKGNSNSSNLGSGLGAGYVPCAGGQVNTIDPNNPNGCLSTAGGVYGICQQLSRWNPQIGYSVDGTQVCHVTASVPVNLSSGQGQLPRIGAGEVNPNIFLRQHDVMSISANGNYGTWANFSFNQCSDYGLDGHRSGGNDVAGSGLYARDGAGQFYVGYGLNYRVASADAVLTFGFSTSLTTNACSYAQADVILERCYDASGNLHQCR